MKSFSKSNFVKVLGATTLAILIATAGIFAFAPMTENAEVLNAHQKETTESTGLISPKEDDPVLFTTESGLEIKYGNNTTMLGGGNEVVDDSIVEGTLSSGNLSGFPYFITNDGTNDYTWVIIGKSSSFDTQINYQTFTYWKETVQGDPHTYSETMSKFFEEQFEASTPCGNALQSNISSDYIARKLSYSISTSLSNVNANEEIPHGCVLVLSNITLANGVFRSEKWSSDGGSTNIYSRCKWPGSQIESALNTYYTQGSYGLNKIKNSIQSTTITTYAYYREYRESATWRTTSTTNRLFVLSHNSSSNFKWSSYLTATKIKLTANQWLRDNVNTNVVYDSNDVRVSYGSVINSSGAQADLLISSSVGYRPAFVMSLC